MPASPSRLEALRAQVARIERGLRGGASSVLPLGPAIDRHLPEGGLARGALHEVQAADPGAGLAFCASLLGRLGGPVLWIAPDEDAVWLPGLEALGLRMGRLLLARYRRPAEGLWAMEEALRDPGLRGVLLEIPSLDLIAARRLQLAAEARGGLGLLLRPAPPDAGPGASGPGAPCPGAPCPGAPSHALTRWRVASRAEAGGTPGWQLDLLRCRGGQPGSWRLRGGAPGLASEPPAAMAAAVAVAERASLEENRPQTDRAASRAMAPAAP